DRETHFYYNVREIQQQSDKPNTMQNPLQTRIKVFYRPQALSKIEIKHTWQYKITIQRQGNGYQLSNPTGYYVVISNSSNRM
ncbi:fimbria/pilus periplasmic chaperone, partial [Salmonella enterica]|uniref:fimbria/pilus periplasmic chaperone n=1 Tax=Salmonella enterica TaxID=28901 RepID=UPI003F1E25A0